WQRKLRGAVDALLAVWLGRRGQKFFLAAIAAGDDLAGQEMRPRRGNTGLTHCFVKNQLGSSFRGAAVSDLGLQFPAFGNQTLALIGAGQPTDDMRSDLQ